MKHYHNNLNEYIKRSGITAEELAEVSNVSKTAIYRYISGERVPKLDVGLRICRNLDADMYDIWVEAEEIRRTYRVYIPRLESNSRKNKFGMGRMGKYHSNFGYVLNSSRYDKAHFAKALDVSRRAIYDYIDGNSLPDVIAAAKIEVLLNMELRHIWPYLYENRDDLWVTWPR